jgi:hypothetical protein
MEVCEVGTKTLKNSGFTIARSNNYDLNAKLNAPNVTIFGEKCDQPFTAFYVWEKFLFAYKDKIRRFLELGCDNGGMSTYFALWCHNINADYHGYDKNRSGSYKDTPIKKLVQLHKKIQTGNIYVDKSVEEVKTVIQRTGMSVVFCDCIDKPWEFKTYAPMLKTGDVVVVHDWDRAIKDKWVSKTILQVLPFELLYEEERLELNTLTRFFLKG